MLLFKIQKAIESAVDFLQYDMGESNIFVQRGFRITEM